MKEIYLTTNLINGKIYVGQHKTPQPLLTNQYYGSGLLLSRSIKKHGKVNFEKRVLLICEDNWSDYYEKELIKLYKSTLRNVGYNITLGGGGGDTISNHPNRVEILKKISATQKIVQNRPETKEKNRLSNSKVIHTEEWNRKMALSHVGKKLTQAQREYISSQTKKAMADPDIKRRWNDSNPIESCMHCGKKMRKISLARWHNGNCRFKKIEG